MLRERERVNAFLRQRPEEGSDFAQTLTTLLTLAPPAVVASEVVVGAEQTIEAAQLVEGASGG